MACYVREGVIYCTDRRRTYSDKLREYKEYMRKYRRGDDRGDVCDEDDWRGE